MVLLTSAIGGANIALANMQQTQNHLTPTNIEQAAALLKNDACLADNPSAKEQVYSINSLNEETGPWTSHIHDAPAGTNVDVNIASYSNNDTITGSLIYSGNHGSYNFTLTSRPEGWRYATFTGCIQN